MELQNDFEEPVGERRSQDNNSNGVFLVPQSDRPAMRQRFLYFVPRDSMFFPYFLFDEGFNDKFAEPQVNPILRTMGQENNPRSTAKQIGLTIAPSLLYRADKMIREASAKAGER